MKEIEKYEEIIFENIKHIDDNGVEYWEARELQLVLEYKEWRKFNNVINKAIIACLNSNYRVDDHFAKVGKMVQIGSGAKRIQDDYKLLRYACYLIVHNSNTYFI